ncbi:cytochrome c oxidase subunit II [uncultured Rhodoblastus sp.]|uniref:cytochrome c oxidase subunit II n=1 Tax=uncultured Rhodoblastus sp. TaxID=543037 RepID=UPI0025CF2475|nr:cytochrome c oxidase subunit II [uncultured Rhodoblastus sp.]
MRNKSPVSGAHSAMSALRRYSLAAGFGLFSLATCSPFAALAQQAQNAQKVIVQAPGDGFPAPGQLGMQTPNSPIAEEIQFLHNDILMPIITIISLFVLALLVYVVLRFNEKTNPTPSRTTHHALLEVAWTIIPVMILVVIAIPSFRLLTHQLVIPQPDVTIKVTGNQWYWSYAYPKDQGGGFGFDSFLKPEDQIDPSKGDIWLLSVDNEAVVPVGKNVLIQMTASDVIHSFTVPAFGVRIDAVPGRLNTAWFRAEREGVYYGQCSKICGKDHAFMPIAVRVVSEQAYALWLAQAQKKFAQVPNSMPAPGQVAEALQSGN